MKNQTQNTLEDKKDSLNKDKEGKHAIIDSLVNSTLDELYKVRSEASYLINIHYEMLSVLEKAKIYFNAKGGLAAFEREEILKEINSVLTKAKS